MKATGIVRRIDDLGRVVIPKEIRRLLRIREGDPLELFTTNDGIVFKKYRIADMITDSDDLNRENASLSLKLAAKYLELYLGETY